MGLKTARFLPGRTSIMIKNRFYSFIRRKDKIQSLLKELDQKPSSTSSEEKKNSSEFNMDVLVQHETEVNDFLQRLKTIDFPPNSLKIVNKMNLDCENFFAFDTTHEDELRDRISSPLKDHANNGDNASFILPFKDFDHYFPQKTSFTQTKDFEEKVSMTNSFKVNDHRNDLFTYTEISALNERNQNTFINKREELAQKEQDKAGYCQRKKTDEGNILSGLKEDLKINSCKEGQKEILNNIDHVLSSLVSICSHAQVELKKEKQRLGIDDS